MGIRAAGAVLWRRADGGALVAVIHRPRHGDWTLPKGKLDPGESELDAAVREVGEETGWQAVVGRDLGTVGYEVVGGGRRRPKTVRYWAMEATSGAFSPGPEVDELRWLAPHEAAALLTYDRDRAVLRRFLALEPV